MSLNYIERLLLQLEEDVTRLVRDQLLGIEGTNMPMGNGGNRQGPPARTPKAILQDITRRYGLRQNFGAPAQQQAQQLTPLKGTELAQRKDLRHVPFVTIDGADSRDFDDAVHAQPWKNKLGRQKGWRVTVAIADVAHYVNAGSPLDAEAHHRATSTYFPNSVLPMLPKQLSNQLCSLVPHEDRPVLAMEMWVDNKGNLIKQELSRAVIRSHARLTYTQMAAAMKGKTDGITGPLWQPALKHLEGAYKSFAKARKRRGALDFDLPEARFDVAGDKVTAIKPYERTDAHRLIEEMMISANVSAANILHGAGRPALYRVHPVPPPERLNELKKNLNALGIKHKLSKKPTAKQFQELMESVASRPDGAHITSQILRTQTAAEYTTNNDGHFGLGLERYVHFTSPIRRYADLVTHRQLIDACNLPGQGGLQPSAGQMKQVAQHITRADRQAAGAMREADKRFTAAFYAPLVGRYLSSVRVTGVRKNGLIVSLDGVSEGMIPTQWMQQDPADNITYDDRRNQLLNTRTGKRWQVGDTFGATLAEADLNQGRLTLAMGNRRLKDLGLPDPAPTRPRTPPTGPSHTPAHLPHNPTRPNPMGPTR